MAVVPRALTTRLPLVVATAAEVWMALLPFETPERTTPLPAYIAPLRVRPIPATALAAVTVPALVLSMVRTPGRFSRLVPTVPGFRAEPFDLMVRLTSLVLPVAKVMLPVVIAEALEPAVTSKTRLLAVPLTLAATVIAPV